MSLKSSVKQTTIPIENYSSAFQSTRDKTSCLVNLVNIWSENDSAILRFAASSFSKRERLIARLIKNKKQILGAASTRSFYFRTFEIAFNLFSFKINLKNQSVITVAGLLLLLYFHLIEKCSSDVMQSGTAVSINRSLYSCTGGSFRTEDISFTINEFSGFSVMRMEERGRTHPRCLIWWGHRGRWDISISCYLATACWSVKAVCIASWSLVYCSYTKTTLRITPFSESLQKKKTRDKNKNKPSTAVLPQECPLHQSTHSQLEGALPPL